MKNELFDPKDFKTVWTCDKCGKEFNTKKEADKHELNCKNKNKKNTSGQGENSIVPEEIKGWSWAAFLWNFIWAIPNKTYIGLIALVPYAGMIMSIILGINGNEWAWRNRKWESVEQFKKYQRKWVNAFLIFIGITFVLFILILSAINPTKKTSTSYSNNYSSSYETKSDDLAEEVSTPTLIPTTKVVKKVIPTTKPAETNTQKTQESGVSATYKSALVKASLYANTMYMSKRGVYDQLVSEYGEKFSADAAQYGIDNVKANWNANALKKAKMYQDTMSMSPDAIRDQLVSDYGEKFTVGEADYAIQHLND